MSEERSGRGEISVNVFDHLVELAALALDPEEREYLRRELNGQLRAIRALEAIDVDEALPITSHGVPYSDATRPSIRIDKARDAKLAEAILAQAPMVENRYLVVPDIPQEALE